MDRITIEQILDPITPRKFFKEYWNKKHLVIRRNSFKNLYTWNHFSNYLNQYPKINNLQIIDYNDKNDRWCLDKIRKGELKAPMISKQKVYDLFKNKNKTIVIPFAEYQNKALVDVCFTLERFFGSGQSNVYISPSAKSKSFPAHADSTENFLFHTEGRVKWKIYEEFAPGKPKNVIDEYNFKVTQIEDSKRNKWYNWKPELYINDKINPDFAYNFRHTGGWKKKYL
jgi:ribosomal protein L16 Arg81 hydroxylase